MSGISHYLRYFIKNAPSTLHGRLHHSPKRISSFRGEKKIDVSTSGLFLRQKIKEGKPFAAIRFGAVELSCLNNHEKIVLGFKKNYKPSVLSSMKLNAGFYPSDAEHLNAFCALYEKEIGQADVLAISGLHMEDYFAEKLLPHAHVITNWALEPLLGGWTPLLKGKKVLVISPFANEIVSQYARREKIFPNEPDLLPEFQLRVIASPLTLGEVSDFPFPTFFETLQDLEQKISQTDFDIALIGCGAYGTLLTLYCKSLGKMALQSGGATQTLFGIIGKRWEERDHVKKRINESWIRPENKPRGYEKIDKGAYW
jgi:hypothetical protein